MPHFTLTRRATVRSGAALLAAGILPARIAQAQAGGGWPVVEALLSRYVDERKVAGMVAGLGWRQEAPAFVARGLDAFTRDRMSDADSLYRIYSMTKPITGMAAMVLVDEGKLSLDKPIAEWLPAYAAMQVQKVPDGPITPDNLVPAERPITLRHLLTHTAGLGYGVVQQGPIRDAMLQQGLVPGQVSRLPIPQLERGRAIGPLARWADAFAALPLVYQPGTRWSYSVGLDLAGRLVEVASGQPFDVFLQERIFGPCGMDSTWFRVPASETGRLTDNYFRLGDTLLPIDPAGNSIYLDQPAFPFGGAGLVSSPRDYDRFLQMLAGQGTIDGRRVMSAAAVRRGTSDLMPETVPAGSGFSFQGQPFGYGAGGLVGTGALDGLYGWFGAAGTGGLVDMKRGLRMALFTQYMPSTAYPLDREFVTAVLADAASRA